MSTGDRFEWKTASPATQGMDHSELERWWVELMKRRTDALPIARGDQIVFERYAQGWSRTRPHYTASMANPSFLVTRPRVGV